MTPYHWQPCISQFSDITKGIILQKFSQTKKRDYQLIAVSITKKTKSENLTTASGIGRPRLYNLMSQNCETLGCQWYRVKRINKTYFRE